MQCCTLATLGSSWHDPVHRVFSFIMSLFCLLNSKWWVSLRLLETWLESKTRLLFFRLLLCELLLLCERRLFGNFVFQWVLFHIICKARCFAFLNSIGVQISWQLWFQSCQDDGGSKLMHILDLIFLHQFIWTSDQVAWPTFYCLLFLLGLYRSNLIRRMILLKRRLNKSIKDTSISYWKV